MHRMFFASSTDRTLTTPQQTLPTHPTDASQYKAFKALSAKPAIARARQALRAAAFALLMGMALPLGAQSSPTKFIPTFLVYYGGGPALVAADAAKLAKFDLIDIDRFRYDNIGSSTWAEIKSLNPDAQIYLYQMGPETPSHLDGVSQLYLNGLGRHDTSRGHSQGSLNGNNPGLFQLDASGKRIYNSGQSNVRANQYWYLMDFGSAAYHAYWTNAVKADIVDQAWRADGIFVDKCVVLPDSGGYSKRAPWYSTNASWAAAMNVFANAITAGMHAVDQKLWCNRGDSRTADGSAAWQALDDSASPPDVVLEEGAFAVQWGKAHTNFYSETEWKRQIDTMGAIRNSSVAMLSHTKLMDGQTGVDNLRKPVTYGQTLWYALGSFLLAKNDTLDNSYFMFSGGSGYNRIWWHEEYEKIDLGKAVGTYSVTRAGSVNVYWREFEKGYVFVNPTGDNVASVSLPQASRQLTRTNLSSAVDSIPRVTSIPLPGHHAAILLKAPRDTEAPSVPGGLTGTAVSSTQVNLSWNAATDNVGVQGYVVYLNDSALGTTTTASFQHTGLLAGTTYNYRVSAFDAVPNHSAWTATPVSVTIPAPQQVSPPQADATAPSVPTGLTGTAMSNTQINLSWNASTDNVGVQGYYVYLNDTALGTTTTTSFQHTGLVAGTTYNYRVSAFDAVPNHSAWTATPVSVTTPALLPVSSPGADTTAPSVPTGLAGTAVSNTQVNLSWNASTDDVGVQGYYVYVNDSALGTTTTASFQHTGLVAGTAYNYRVSAYDAVPNHSAWSATPVSVTTTGTAPTSGSGTVHFSCSFATAPNNCGFQEQGKVSGRASIVNFGRDGGTAVRLHTEPGDNNVASSGDMERNDLWLSQQASDGYEGREHWWAHSVLFPEDFAMPTWQMYVVQNFHNSDPGPWQANFHLNFAPGADTTQPGNLVMRGHGGVNSGDGRFGATIGQVQKNVWYDFVYHVKWSSGSDGYFDAWVNGVKLLSHRGPTLYTGQGVYLKLANYHTPVCNPYPGCSGPASSIIHDRVIRGSSALAVSAGPLEGELILVDGVLTPVQ